MCADALTAVRRACQPPGVARIRTIYACGACGHQASRWVGRCPECGEWGSIEELAPAAASAAARNGGPAPATTAIGDVDLSAVARRPTGVAELDRVLGGGLVDGSLVLLGGEPGIGKSTLVLQVLASCARSCDTLLVTGEESATQVASRATRLEADCAAVRVLAETRLEAVMATLEAERPTVCAIDSVQTLASDTLDGAPGTVAQIRQATAELVRAAKTLGVTIILVGQVTKDGGLAGPKLLEHLVDCVLTFEGDHMREHRVLRCAKNRFGATNEVAVFEMGATGLTGVPDPTRLYLAEVGERVGSCIYPAVEGSRVVLVEIQALVGPTEVIPPRRVAGGVDRTRLAQVLAVLGRHAGRRLGDQDVFVSVAAGARAQDPAADLAIALAIVSADRGRPLGGPPAAFGEIGLTGAVRPVGHHDRRLKACSDHRIATILAPPRSSSPAAGGEHPIADVRAAIDLTAV